METSKKKPSIAFLLLGALLSSYLGYLIGGAWYRGIQLNEFIEKFNKVCDEPFANYLNSNTPKCIAMAFFIYVMIVIMYFTSQRNFMLYKEYGTAKFESPQ